MSFSKKPPRPEQDEEQAITHLCSSCQNDAVFAFRYLNGFPATGGRSDSVNHQCMDCYERRRVLTPVDERFFDVFRARQQEWKRQNGEPRSDYHARMMGVLSGLLSSMPTADSASRLTERDKAPADSDYFGSQ